MFVNATADPTPATAIKEAFNALGGAQKSSSISSWIHNQYPDWWTDRKIGQYLRGCSVNHPKAISYHPDFPKFLFCHGWGQFELYERSRHGSYDERGYLVGASPVDELPPELTGLGEAEKREFAYEAHLRDFLVNNLELLEVGLKPWSTIGESVEFPVDSRRVDILAKDGQGIPVVIELKLSRGHERTLGQVLYYRGKLRELLSAPRVRIMMVAGDVSDELRIASSEVGDVELFSYALTMKLEKIAK